MRIRRPILALVVLQAVCLWALTARGQSPQGAQTGQTGNGAAAQSQQPSSAAQQPTQAQPSQQKAPAASQQPAAEPQMQVVEGAQQESLADVARRMKAKRAKSAASKVVTDDDVSKLSGDGVSVVGDGSSGESSSGGENGYAVQGSSAGGDAGGAQGGDNGEKYWRGRARDIMNQIAATDQQISKLKDEIAKTGPTGVDPTTGLTQNVIIIHDRNAQLKQLEDRKASLEKQLDDLADEGRKAGADSSWFR